jgi:hypothetical protein
MKKGFLCGPAAQKADPPKEDASEDKARATGAVPKVKVEAPKVKVEAPMVKVEAGKKRRRTRSKGSSLSPSPGIWPGTGAPA